MDTPTQDVKQQFTYAVDQQVSVNAFIDVEIEGENVRFQITSRYNSTADKIVKTTKEAIAAFAAFALNIHTQNERPRPHNPRRLKQVKRKSLRISLSLPQNFPKVCQKVSNVSRMNLIIS